MFISFNTRLLSLNRSLISKGLRLVHTRFDGIVNRLNRSLISKGLRLISFGLSIIGGKSEPLPDF